MLYAILGTSRMEEAMVKAIVGANWGDEGKDVYKRQILRNVKRIWLE